MVLTQFKENVIVAPELEVENHENYLLKHQQIKPYNVDVV
jgi:hypothetical protein